MMQLEGQHALKVRGEKSELYVQGILPDKAGKWHLWGNLLRNACGLLEEMVRLSSGCFMSLPNLQCLMNGPWGSPFYA